MSSLQIFLTRKRLKEPASKPERAVDRDLAEVGTKPMAVSVVVSKQLKSRKSVLMLHMYLHKMIVIFVDFFYVDRGT
jgi:hypothetical protein